jgi:hypothetical protein
MEDKCKSRSTVYVYIYHFFHCECLGMKVNFSFVIFFCHMYEMIYDNMYSLL